MIKIITLSLLKVSSTPDINPYIIPLYEFLLILIFMWQTSLPDLQQPPGTKTGLVRSPAEQLLKAVALDPFNWPCATSNMSLMSF